MEILARSVLAMSLITAVLWQPQNSFGGPNDVCQMQSLFLRSYVLSQMVSDLTNHIGCAAVSVCGTNTGSQTLPPVCLIDFPQPR